MMNMHYYCNKTNKIIIAFLWWWLPSPAVSSLSYFNRINTHTANTLSQVNGAHWPSITPMAWCPLSSESFLTQPHRQPLLIYQSGERKPVCHPRLWWRFTLPSRSISLQTMGPSLIPHCGLGSGLPLMSSFWVPARRVINKSQEAPLMVMAQETQEGK